jgi:2-hydroxy-3-keto-5-methylthiopentenyl-1-phosphate phosphatase
LNPAASIRLICDFDNTITVVDTPDLIFSMFAPGWESLETEWLEGQITAAECMRRQVALIDADDADIDAALDGVEIRPGFAGLVSWCQQRDIDISIVSDGVDYFLTRILDRHGLGWIQRTSNRLAGDRRLRSLEQPHERPDCTASSGVCKCAAVHGAPALTVFIGDGRSDFCVSANTDILFARSKLLAYSADRHPCVYPFETFDDVVTTLDRIITHEINSRDLYVESRNAVNG